MPYTLSLRQKAAFSDTIDIYAGTPIGLTNKLYEGRTYTSATYSGVKCRIQQETDIVKPKEIGMTSRDIVMTTDILRLHSAQAIKAGDYIQVKTSGHPDLNTWYVVHGNARIHFWRAKESTYALARASEPPGQ